MNTTARYWAIVPAAGIGARFASEIPKQYAPMAGATVLQHALRTLFLHPKLHAVVVALASNDTYFSELELVKHGTQLDTV